MFSVILADHNISFPSLSTIRYSFFCLNMPYFFQRLLVLVILVRVFCFCFCRLQQNAGAGGCFPQLQTAAIVILKEQTYVGETNVDDFKGMMKAQYWIVQKEAPA